MSKKNDLQSQSELKGPGQGEAYPAVSMKPDAGLRGTAPACSLAAPGRLRTHSDGSTCSLSQKALRREGIESCILRLEEMKLKKKKLHITDNHKNDQ